MSETSSSWPSFALGVDIGGTTIKAAVVSTTGELFSQCSAPTPRSTDAIRAFIDSALQKTNEPLAGIGIGCKGIINAEISRVDRLPGELHFLEGTSFTGLMGDSLPVRADNDARTALIAEVLWGAGRGKRNVVLLTLGTGVGGAVMSDGVILHGTAGVAGHLGHMIVDPHGCLCMCGVIGCLETRFSSRSIEGDYFEHVHRAARATLPMSASGGPPSTEAVFGAAANGDPSARRVIDRAMEYLSAAVVSLLHIFDPEVVILGGNIAAAGEQLLQPIRTAAASCSRGLLGREVPIVPQCTIGYGGVQGAAGLIFLHQQLLKIGDPG